MDATHRESNSSSWGEYIKSYESEKGRNSQFKNSSDFLNAFEKRVTNLDIARREREFNPILQKYVNKEREEKQLLTEDKQKVLKVNQGKDKQLKFESDWDIISGKPRYKSQRSNSNREKSAKYPSSFVDYNIISGSDLDSSNYNLAYFGNQRKNKKNNKNSLSTKVEGRDYDIISNKYFKDHENRIQNETNEKKKRAVSAYWKHNKFNPLTSTYVNPNEETKMRQLEEQRKHFIEKIHTERLPQGTRFSEGELYNITSMEVRDAERLESVETKKANRKAYRKKKYEFENTISKREIENKEKSERRKISGISHRRYLDRLQHGYDVLTGENYDGSIKGKLPPPAYTKSRISVWEQILRERQEAIKKNSQNI